MTAEAHLAAGNYDAAAEEYIRLAEKDKNNANSLFLQAASAYLDGDNAEAAGETLSRVVEKKITPEQTVPLNIVKGRLALARHEADAALAMLDFPLPVDVPSALSARYYQTRARAHAMMGQQLVAVRERVQADPYLATDTEHHANNRDIWELLTQVPAAELEQELATAGAGALPGWLELALIAGKSLPNRAKLDIALYDWRQRHGPHAGGEQIIPQLLAAAVDTEIVPRHIALLLPFNPQHHEAATAIRDGFLAAWYDAASDATRPRITVHDTSTGNITDVYHLAVAEGADFVVGPLGKEAVAALVDAGNLPVRVLALNQVASSPLPQAGTAASVTPFVYQFGLLPEDDARLAADRAWFDGYANALVMTTGSSWGNRVYQAFSSQWLALGGRIIEHVTIGTAPENLVLSIKQLLNIDQSELRAKELGARLGKKIHFEPRHRQDADLIFIEAPPLTARQIMPQFRYFGATDLPVYSIAGVYSGIRNPAEDQDINGITFADMPWLVDPQLEYSALRRTLYANWDLDHSTYQRLYALGIDAYRVIPELGLMFRTRERTFSGVTGTLKLTPEGIVQRTPSWVRMVNGATRLLDQAPGGY